MQNSLPLVITGNSISQSFISPLGFCKSEHYFVHGLCYRDLWMMGTHLLPALDSTPAFRQSKPPYYLAVIINLQDKKSQRQPLINCTFFNYCELLFGYIMYLLSLLVTTAPSPHIVPCMSLCMHLT